MQSTEFVERVRELVDVGTETEFPSVQNRMILEIANDKLVSVLGKHILDADAGHWMLSTEITVTPDRTKYRLPTRVLNGGVYQVEVYQTSQWRQLDLVTAKHASQYREPLQACMIQGDSLVMLAPASGLIRVWYYSRPNKIVPSQTAGMITAIDLETRKLSWNNNPQSSVNGVLDPVLSEPCTVDIISPQGWYQCQIVDMPLSITSGGIIAPAGYAIEDVQVGDYIRLSGQSDWPALPEEDHSLLAGLTAVVVAQLVNDSEKASQIANTIGKEYADFPTKLSPRVLTQAKRIPLRGRY